MELMVKYVWGVTMLGTRVIVTYNCNMFCNCCEFKCAPYRKGSMAVGEFKEKVQASYNNGYKDYINIEGGEPFLNAGIIHKYLKAIFNTTSKKYIKTNGYWGTMEPFLDILMEFKKADLNGLIIEYDYYHSLFIDIEIIRQATLMARTCGLEVIIKACFNTQNISSPEDIKTFEYIKIFNKEFKNMNYSFRTIKENKTNTKENIILL